MKRQGAVPVVDRMFQCLRIVHYCISIPDGDLLRRYVKYGSNVHLFKKSAIRFLPAI